VQGTVRFGDDSVAEIEGRGTVEFLCKDGEHRVFVGVYYIPRLMANIISLGQLDELDYDIHIGGAKLEIREPGGRLLARVEQRPNRLYVLDVNVARREVCLSAREEAVAKRWHARLGHVNMPVLRRMANQEVVHGLPLIGAVGELCEACMVGKQKRSHFPDRAAWRAERALELAHGDLCGPISPATPSGNAHFLLLVNDRSRYMWVSTLVSKGSSGCNDQRVPGVGRSGVWVQAGDAAHG
jgi:hypothetical protein